MLSYVGGIFPTLFGLFFFIGSFGLYFFEMTFAYIHFKCKEVKPSRHFGPFLKNSVYIWAKSLGWTIKKWKIAKKQCEVNDLVNKMLDINYLYRRI